MAWRYEFSKFCFVFVSHFGIYLVLELTDCCTKSQCKINTSVIKWEILKNKIKFI